MPAQAVAIIPARLGSTRFPAKALADETGKPLVVHVCEQACRAELVSRVVVATDDEQIRAGIESHGFEAVMTSIDHPNGTSRLAQAAQLLGLNADQVVVNVQGDEPEIEPEIIDGAILAMCVTLGGRSEPATVGTVVSAIGCDEDANNPNIVKAALGTTHDDEQIAQALCFSRACIPFNRDGLADVARYRHVGIYAYKNSALQRYPGLEETPLERAERLEQLRWLEHGYTINAAIRTSSHSGIDTPEQYRSFVERYRQKNL